jgi:hypothetical protein
MSLRGNLYRSARILGDMQAVTSGNPKRIERRAKNKLIGRALGRAGILIQRVQWSDATQEIEREAAQLERDRAELEDLRKAGS